jgi:hypothetical protein
MRVLFQRVTFVSLLAIFFSLTSFSWAAPPPISFDTKYTHLLDKIKKVPITGPGNFDIYQFSGTPNYTDVAVPTHNDLGTLLGLENLNNWPSTTIDTYYNNHSFTSADKINLPRQVISGNFDGNMTKDLVIINYDSFVVCYDYTGDACSGGYSNLYQESWGPSEFKSHLIPWAGAVADFDGDGKDDLAIIGYAVDNGTGGYLYVYKNNGTGGPTPFTGTYNAPTNANPNTSEFPFHSPRRISMETISSTSSPPNTHCKCLRHHHRRLFVGIFNTGP